MSGGFDFPPASDSSTPIGSLTRRFDSLRQTFQTERDERAAQRERSHALPTQPPTIPRPRRRTTWSRSSGNIMPSIHRTRSPLSASPGFPPQDTPPITDRLRQVAVGTRQQLRRLRQEMRQDNQDIGDELRERRDLLDRMSNHLDGMLHRRDSDASELSSRAETETSLRGIDPAPSTSMPRHRSFKRRKLVHEPEVVVPKPYGHYGQVDPGHLRMEIVSCDGGQFPARDSRMFSLESYRAENVLRKDDSVYCTKSSRCNLMLRQQGEALFHLESLVIAAPKRGYTAPIQQGLVFVGMSAEELAARTANYSIKYSDDDISHATRTRSPTPQPRESDRLSLLEAVNDEQIWQASRSRYDLTEPPIILPPPRIPEARAMRYPTLDASRLFFRPGVEPGDDDDASRASGHGNAFLDNCDWPPYADPNAASSGLTRAPTPPPFTVVPAMESSDDESGDRHDRENSYGPYGMPPLIPEDATTTDTDSDGPSLRARASRLLRRQYGHPARPIRRSTPGRIGRESVEGDVEEEGEEEEEEGLRPDGTFFMKKENKESKVVIPFDPPLAGKFILLKLFSPQLRDGPNIDIQYVAAYGYSGPRFFPSVELK